MLVPISEGEGFPLICEGSHTTSDIPSVTTQSPRPIPQKEGSVVLFDAKIARQDPEVTAVMGGSAILMLY